MNTIHSGKWLDEGYTLIIGHRRCEAAKAAGLDTVPCRIIEHMEKKDQVSTMLEENMQRNDLTIYEQAQGFQMMLDLGETEDSIAEKTGFSKTTVKHRLNIAKLDQKELQKKEGDDNFQLSIKDLYALEKIKDIRKRNKILKEASSSRDLVSRAQSAVAEEKRAKNAKAIEGMLKKLGVKKAPKGAENEMWSGKWKTIKEFELNFDVPKRIRLPKEKEQMYFLVHYSALKVIIKAPKGKRELSPYEKEEKRKSKIKRQVRAILKESSFRRKEFIQNIISGKIDAVKDEEKEKCLIWQAFAPLGTSVFESTLKSFFLTKQVYECTEDKLHEVKSKVENLSMLHQMLIILHESMKNNNELFYWNGTFNAERGKALLKGYEALEPYGWYFENEEEKQVLDGTHELYEEMKEGVKK
ncbi:MAG: ParB/RepB/Spo0J family partition protein [Roseburia sp.]|nr:ParB/RepB/Spo0J family partition protein [Roseburia sp.]